MAETPFNFKTQTIVNTITGTAIFFGAESTSSPTPAPIDVDAIKDYIRSSLPSVALSGAYTDLSGKPTLGTAAALNVPANGNASTTEIVKGNDSRLSDARTPLSHTHVIADVISLQTTLDAKVNTSSLGTANGVATLGPSGLILSSQLPAYVDDVLEYANLAAFPATGEAGKIYIALDTNKTYRWSGSVYVIIASDLALGETSSTAYRGDRGKTAYDHSQTTGNPHGTTKADLGLGNVDNTSDASKPISTAVANALALKASAAGQNTIATVGIVLNGTWQASAIADQFIASSATWNAKLDANSRIDGGTY